MAPAHALTYFASSRLFDGVRSNRAPHEITRNSSPKELAATGSEGAATEAVVGRPWSKATTPESDRRRRTAVPQLPVSSSGQYGNCSPFGAATGCAAPCHHVCQQASLRPWQHQLGRSRYPGTHSTPSSVQTPALISAYIKAPAIFSLS